jgi:choline dehydrogenase-like flavoprotein
MTEFDYLVVGDGTAGCILAARLAEDPAVSVADARAGSRSRSPLSSPLSQHHRRPGSANRNDVTFMRL